MDVDKYQLKNIIIQNSSGKYEQQSHKMHSDLPQCLSDDDKNLHCIKNWVKFQLLDAKFIVLPILYQYHLYVTIERKDRGV